jgi:hypothetical protein
MQDLLGRFISFDKLIGPILVKLVYYVFAVIIIVATIGGLFSALMSFASGNLGAGLMQALAVPAVGAVSLVTWRFLCELFILAFKTYERLGEVRDRLPDYSQF